jgi:hypothetical protein
VTKHEPIIIAREMGFSDWLDLDPYYQDCLGMGFAQVVVKQGLSISDFGGRWSPEALVGSEEVIWGNTGNTGLLSARHFSGPLMVTPAGKWGGGRHRTT